MVDLHVFRAMRAGDSLRSIYDNLSADPNSLANLDQDLPNYAQHMVPILSLPMEWLWCQTWCSMDTLRAGQDHRPLQQPAHQDAQAGRGQAAAARVGGAGQGGEGAGGQLLAGLGTAVNSTGYSAAAGAGAKASKVEEYNHVGGVKAGSDEGAHDEL